jgi:phosphoribosylpyrophosphate synthetase
MKEMVKARLGSSTATSYIVLCCDNIPGMLQIPDYRNAVIVARNPGSAKKATSYAERLRLGIAVIHGEQKEAESDMVDGRYSPPTLSRSRTMDVSVGVPVHPAKEKPPINVVGDVGGRIAIMVVSWQLLPSHSLVPSEELSLE